MKKETSVTYACDKCGREYPQMIKQTPSSAYYMAENKEENHICMECLTKQILEIINGNPVFIQSLVNPLLENSQFKYFISSVITSLENSFKEKIINNEQK